MLKILVSATLLTLAAAPALAQHPTLGPTPREQVGMHVGDANTNGSAVIVNDRNGIHPEGYVGQQVRNHAVGDSGPRTHHKRYHHRRVTAAPLY